MWVLFLSMFILLVSGPEQLHREGAGQASVMFPGQGGGKSPKILVALGNEIKRVEKEESKPVSFEQVAWLFTICEMR